MILGQNYTAKVSRNVIFLFTSPCSSYTPHFSFVERLLFGVPSLNGVPWKKRDYFQNENPINCTNRMIYAWHFRKNILFFFLLLFYQMTSLSVDGQWEAWNRPSSWRRRWPPLLVSRCPLGLDQCGQKESRNGEEGINKASLVTGKDN